MEYRKLYDFMASVVLIALGVFVVVSGYAITEDSRAVFYDAPGFLPIILGFALSGCSALLLLSSLRDGGLRARLAELGSWGRGAVRSKDAAIASIGILVMFVYSFFLFKLVPFWISSFLFLVGIMAYLKATKPMKGLLISACTVAAIVLFFQVGFRVQLP